jgi:hypothetical protein
VNRIFEHAGVPYGRRLESGAEVCKEAAKRRKRDAGVGPSRKHMKGFG